MLHLRWTKISFSFIFYHPQRSWGKVIFSQASVILSTGGGDTWAGTPPAGPGAPPDQIHPPGPGTPPGPDTPPATSSACWEIWATSGRYTSYWNAFLLLNKQPILFKLHFTCCFLLFQNPCKNTFMSSCNLQSIYFEVNSDHHKIYRI